MKAKQVFISLGSNMGDKLQFLKNAIEEIRIRLGKVVKESKIYEAAAWGHTKQPNFFNQVIEIETELSPMQLLQGCLDVFYGVKEQSTWIFCSMTGVRFNWKISAFLIHIYNFAILYWFPSAK
jgi:hypothetical protein